MKKLIMVYNLFEVRAGAFVFNENDELFLLKNCKGTWGIIGGHLEENEQIGDAIRREVKEETNMDLGDVCFLETRAVGDSFIVAFTTKYVGGEVKLDGVEVTDWKWVGLSDLSKYDWTFPALYKDATNALSVLKKH